MKIGDLVRAKAESARIYDIPLVMHDYDGLRRRFPTLTGVLQANHLAIVLEATSYGKVRVLLHSGAVGWISVGLLREAEK